MRQIHKYEIPPSALYSPYPLSLGPTARFLHFGVDNFNNFVAWFEVNTNEPAELWQLSILPTGAEVDAYKMKHLETIIVREEWFVWHLYRVHTNGN